MSRSASVTLFFLLISTVHSLYTENSREEPDDGSGELISDDWSTSMNFPQTIILPPEWESNTQPDSTPFAAPELTSELSEATIRRRNKRQNRPVRQRPLPPRRRPIPVQSVPVPMRVAPIVRPGPTFSQIQHHSSLHLYD